MSPSPKRNHSDPVINVVPVDDEERRPCCPVDPPERADPIPPADLKHPHKTRCRQSERELYQNRFLEDL